MSIKQLIEGGGSIQDIGRLVDPTFNGPGKKRPGDEHEPYYGGVPTKRKVIAYGTDSLVEFMKNWNADIPTDLKSRQQQFGAWYQKVYGEHYIGTSKQNSRILTALTDQLLP